MGPYKAVVIFCLLNAPWIKSEIEMTTVVGNYSGEPYRFEAGDILDSVDQSEMDEALEQVINNLSGLFIYNIAAIGLANQAGSDLSNPRWYLVSGELAAAPPFTTIQGNTALEGFPSASASLYGPEGVWSYDIQGTNYMVVVAWSVPNSDLLYEEKFNVKIYPRGLNVNKDLHSQMMEYGSWLAINGQYEQRREYGVEILGFMTEADYSKIMVWIETDGFDENEGPEHYTGCSYHPWWFGDYCWRTCNLGWCWIDKGCSGDSDCYWTDTKDYPCYEGHDGC